MSLLTEASLIAESATDSYGIESEDHKYFAWGNIRYVKYTGDKYCTLNILINTNESEEDIRFTFDANESVCISILELLVDSDTKESILQKLQTLYLYVEN